MSYHNATYGHRVAILFSIILSTAFIVYGSQTLVTQKKAPSKASGDERSFDVWRLPTLAVAYPLWERYAVIDNLDKPYTEYDSIMFRLRKSFLEVTNNEAYYVTNSYIVNDIPVGQVYGVMPKQWKGRTMNEHDIIFATTPLKAFRDRILVVMSIDSPPNTIILLLDKDLKVQKLYQTGKKSQIIPNFSISIDGLKDQIGLIANIRVLGEGIYLLQQEGGFSFPPMPEDIGRLIEMRIDKHSFRLREASEGAEEKYPDYKLSQ